MVNIEHQEVSETITDSTTVQQNQHSAKTTAEDQSPTVNRQQSTDSVNKNSSRIRNGQQDSILDDLIKRFSPPLEHQLIISIVSEHLTETTTATTTTTTTTTTTELEHLLNTLVNQTISNIHYNQLQQPPISVIDQIKSILPDYDHQSIIRAISRSSDQEDLDQVVEILLNGSSINQDSVDDENSNRLSETRKKKKERKKKSRVSKPSARFGDKRLKTVEKINLTDVLHREERQRNEEAKRYNESDPNKTIQNVWILVDSQANYLSQLLDINPGKIATAYHTRQNIILAVEDILRELENGFLIDQANNNSRKNEDEEDVNDPDRLETQLSFFRELYRDEGSSGDIERNQDLDEKLRRALRVTGVDAGKAFELLKFLDELNQQYGTLNYNFFHHQPDQPIIISNKSNKSNDQSSSSSSSTSSTTNKPNLISNNQSTSNDSHINDDDDADGNFNSEDNFKEIVRLNSKIEQLKINSFSNQHFDRSNRYLKQSISSVYRDDLAELRQLRSSWELRGVKRLIEERRQKQINISRHRTGEGLVAGDVQDEVIDLHGLTRQQALTISTEFLDDWWTRNRGAEESSRRGLRIVTGVGNHSKDFKPSLLPTIKSYLNNNNWKFRELYNCFGSFDGSIRVSGKRRN